MVKKKDWITWIVILAVVIIAGVIIYFQIKNNSNNSVSANLAECIGTNSQLYVQLGCSHCETQENYFRGTLQYLNVTDCYYNASICNSAGIQGTPTWIINGTRYLGVQSISKLKQLTGC